MVLIQSSFRHLIVDKSEQLIQLLIDTIFYEDPVTVTGDTNFIDSSGT